MLNKYKDFISEGIFSFLKRDKYNYNPLYDAMINHVRGYLRRNEIEVVDINSYEYELAIKKAAIEYMNENLVDKTILISDAITNLAEYRGDKNIEIVFKRSELFPHPYGRGELISIYDKKDKRYIINVRVIFEIKIKRKINRQITEVDPLGEEDWGE